MKQGRLLLVEDNPIDRTAFERSVRTQNLPYRCAYATSLSEARDMLRREAFDVILSDYRLGDGSGLDLLAMQLDTPVIFITGAGNEDVAVRAMKAGARDYLIKDVDGNYLKFLPMAVERAITLQRVEDRIEQLSAKASEDVVLVGETGLRDLLPLVELAIASNAPVFITGETGTGKNRLARAIHYQSALRSAPFVSVNCAAIPEHLFEAELFGYERGAFTGAVSARRGLFEQAHGGTLLLDELGELSGHMQTKLLGVLDDKKVRRLGGESTRTVDTRIITTTNVDIELALGRTFRTDLFYRLSVVRIAVPPLRERREDIPDLCAHLVRTLGGGPGVSFAPGELERLQDYDWPGNVRELRNILERALILHHGVPLRPSKLLVASPSRRVARPSLGASLDVPVPHGASAGPEGPVATLQEVEEAHLRSVYARFGNNLARAARALDISLSTMKRKAKAYRLR